MNRKIYVASSWHHFQHDAVVDELRKRGHEVYDFRRPDGLEVSKVWDVLNVGSNVYGETMVSLLDNPLSRARFKKHMEKIMEADVCILLLPCGRSAHIEAGYLKGLGKTVYVFGSVFEELRPELMYLTFDAFFCYYEPLFNALEYEDGE